MMPHLGKREVRLQRQSGIYISVNHILTASFTLRSKNITFLTFQVRDISPIKIVFLESAFHSFEEIILAAIARSSHGSENDNHLDIFAYTS
jgi:hypothetical protein